MKITERFRKAVWIQRATMALLTPALMLMQDTALANPSGGVVVHGAIGFEGLDTGNLVITQGSDKAIINWQDFSIAKGELTQFVQPGKNSSILNRVVSGNPSAIFGTLKANGGVMLINTNGILVGAGGVVDVAGNLTLSTLDIDDNDFLNGGDNRFRGSSAAGVTNFGTISSSEGDVIILGNFVENHGSIGALNGQVALGAGGDIIVHSSGDSKISVVAGGVGGGTGITNTGSIKGAAVELKAHGNVYALAINNSGTTRATGSQRTNGRVILSAGDVGGDITNTGNIEAVNADGTVGEVMIDGGQQGVVNINSGTVSADGTDGGLVTVLGREINVGATAVVSANGQNEGGIVNIGNENTTAVLVDGLVSANGATGGAVNVNSSDSVVINGNLQATGSTGAGGAVSVTGARVSVAGSSTIDAGGFSDGGSILVDSGGLTSVSGSLSANGATGVGGSVIATGADVVARLGSSFSATGDLKGGFVKVGGDLRGDDANDLRESNATTFEIGTKINVDGLNGDGGLAVIWSNGDTIFRGDVTASARGPEGNGGLIEVSGLETLAFRGTVAATSIGGRSGTVLFDPGDVSVGGNGSDIPIQNINTILQAGTSVLIMTEDGDITFEDLLPNSATQDFNNSNWHNAVQWTNSAADFGALAGGNIFVNTHIRTSGAGSINLISGWTGFESDFETGGLFDPDYNPNAGDDPGGARFFDDDGGLGLFGPERVWDYYVENGQFGSGGSTFIGSASMDNNIEVGSRFGNTNVAAQNLFIIAADTNGESRFTQLGFRDAGQVFAPRADNAGFVMAATRDGDPVVAIAGQFEVDVDNDGVADGVQAINSTGVVAGSVIRYANHFNSARAGGWWWQQLDPGNSADGIANNHDALGLGGLRPEHGAGQDEFNRADINVITTASVNLFGGGRHSGAAQIGHGGDAAGWADNRSLNNGGTETNNGSSFVRRWSINGATNDRVATSISRLAPVYGNINVLAGVNTSEAIIYNQNAATQNLTATVDNAAGAVTIQGNQRMGSSNNPSNDNQNDGQFAPAFIGHGGSGQAGLFVGDIYVEAGGDVKVLAGSNTRGAAAIGHIANGYAFWNPKDNQDQQIRFFANSGDFNDPNLRRGALFNGVGGSTILDSNGADRFVPVHSIMDPRLDTHTSAVADLVTGDLARPDGSGRELEFSYAGPQAVEALDGHTMKGFHGSITVISKGLNGVTVKGYETADTRDTALIGTATEANGGLNAREDRWAMIGHGGRGFAVWAEENGYVSNRTDRDRELVGWRIQGANETTQTSSMSIGLESGGGFDRSLTFMNITGDIDVQATAGDVNVIAGNNQFNHAAIGHNGRQLADMETSGVMAGDINVVAAGHISVIGGGLVDYTGNSNQDMRSPAQIGHGGWRNGFLYRGGDINVVAGAAGPAPVFDTAFGTTITANGITMVGGAYANNYAKIGHDGTESYGQVGGDFSRTENFTLDNVSTDITISYAGGVLDVEYVGVTDGKSDANGDHTFGDPTIAGITERFIKGGIGVNNTNGGVNTANITVDSGSAITMTHLEPGDSITDNQFLFDTNGGLSTAIDGFVQIGHGGRNVDQVTTTGQTGTFNDKVGDIIVTAVDDLLMENGAYDGKWTRIGHGGADNADRVGGNEAMELSGTIDVTVGGNLMMDGRAGGENDPNDQNVGVSGFADPVQQNAIQIGHGAVLDAYDVVVIEGTVNGIDSTAGITIDVGNDMTMYAGNGYRASHTQVGHGFASDAANDRSRLNNVPTGFTGDIIINVGNDLYMEASPNAYIFAPVSGAEEFVIGASAVIGHGGTLLDAPSTGNISIFTGNDLTMVGSQRTEALEDDDLGNPLGSVLNTVKIGHYSNEIDRAGGQGPVTESDMEGDILIVVTNDLTMTGSSTVSGNGVAEPIVGAINQIGHGGPGVSGDKAGNITLLVGNNFSSTGGQPTNPGQELNNYTMIGNGDWLRDGFSPSGAFQGPGLGLRSGDINIAIGGNGTFGAANRPVLVGHADKAVQAQAISILFGETRVAVARNFPFYGGTGTLETLGGSVFSSGLYGGNGNVEFYIPERDNNLMGIGTRINEATATYVGTEANFADSVATTGAIFDRSRGIYAGREDEIYLTPDLWWDNRAISTVPGSNPFPTSLAEIQGGSITAVSDPGGIPNLVANNAGVLGSSAPDYRDGNGVSGAGLYTIYYDAIRPVSKVPKALPVAPFIPEIESEIVPVVIPINFLQFLFSDKFDSFDRDDEGLDGLTGEGSGLLAALGLFEGDESGEENGFKNAERALDNIFGSRTDGDEEGEEDEEKRRRRERASRPVGNIGLTYYVFDPQGNKYSSHRVFGAGVAGSGN
ncbi:filamentous hemagglutinin N-terminal domain-containing protein [bacterium]|nr:filamentous hemagglutinin N-terminal domain-containing protein [bacterium]